MKKLYCLVSVIFFFFLIFILELLASFFVEPIAAKLVEHETLNHVWRPNSSYTHEEWVRDNPDFSEPYTHRINSQGWIENYDVSLKKPEGTYRIFHLGDSFVEGPVPMDQSISSYLEKGLRQSSHAEKIKFEIINAGVSSYSPVIHYVLLKDYILKYEPDLVMLTLDMTDVHDDKRYRKIMEVDERGLPKAVPPKSHVKHVGELENASWLSKLSLFLFKHSNIYNFFLVKFPKLNRNFVITFDDVVTREFSWCKYNWDKETAKDVEFTLRMIKSIAELLKNKNVKFLLSTVPHYQQYQIENDRSLWNAYPHALVKDFARQEKISFIDAFSALREQVQGTEQTEYYYKNDMHFNPRGYQIWGEVYLNYFLSNVILD